MRRATLGLFLAFLVLTLSIPTSFANSHYPAGSGKPTPQSTTPPPPPPPPPTNFDFRARTDNLLLRGRTTDSHSAPEGRTATDSEALGSSTWVEDPLPGACSLAPLEIHIGIACAAYKLAYSLLNKHVDAAIISTVSRQAFAQVPWAKPLVSVQPVGGNTLVTIPVYYQVGFTSLGVPPGAVHTIPAGEMLGSTVQVRPRVVGYRYIYGDGEASNITLDRGGVYPSGGITHSYAHPGSYQAYIEALYTADISIDGFPFQPINQTVNVVGPTTTIRVLTSHNILIK